MVLLHVCFKLTLLAWMLLVTMQENMLLVIPQKKKKKRKKQQVQRSCFQNRDWKKTIQYLTSNILDFYTFVLL